MKRVCVNQIIFFRSIKFGGSSTSKVVAEEIIEEVHEDGEPPAKTSRIEILPPKSTETKKKESWNKSIGVLSKKTALNNLVRSKKADSTVTTSSNEKPSRPETATASVVSTTTDNNETNVKNAENAAPVPTGLSLLANYSGSDSDSQ